MFKEYLAGCESFRLNLQNPKGKLTQESFDRVLEFLNKNCTDLYLNPYQHQIVPENMVLMMAQAQTERTRLSGYSLGSEEDGFKCRL